MDDRDLARLLSGRNEPSVLEKEAMFEQIMNEVRPRRRLARWTWSVPVACAAAALLIVWSQAKQDTFNARGSSERQPSLRVICVQTGSRSACPAGGVLAFEVDAQPLRFIALFARSADGRIVWYFPATDARSLAAAEHAAVLRQGARIGSNQPPGRYEIVLVASQAPLTRAEIKDKLTATDQVRVVRVPFDIKAGP